MKSKWIVKLYGIFEGFLALGAIYIGILMITSKDIFREYPSEWLGKVPFRSWFLPGIIAIALYGMGNMAAAIIGLISHMPMAALSGIIMGCILIVSIIIQVSLLGFYLPSVELLILGIIQLLFGLLILRSKDSTKDIQKEHA